jgi:hypothetical protein
MSTKDDRPGASNAHGAGIPDRLGSRSSFPDGTPAPDSVKRVVHIVIGFGKVAVAIKTDVHPWRQWKNLYAPYRDQHLYRHMPYDFWDRLRQLLQPHHEASDEFAPVQLTAHAFNDSLSQAIAQVLMRAGLLVSNQTFMADDDTCPTRPGRRCVNWLVMLDDKLPGSASKERAENYERRTARIRRQARLAEG